MNDISVWMEKQDDGAIIHITCTYTSRQNYFSPFATDEQ